MGRENLSPQQISHYIVMNFIYRGITNQRKRKNNFSYFLFSSICLVVTSCMKNNDSISIGEWASLTSMGNMGYPWKWPVTCHECNLEEYDERELTMTNYSTSAIQIMQKCQVLRILKGRFTSKQHGNDLARGHMIFGIEKSSLHTRPLLLTFLGQEEMFMLTSALEL